MNAIFKRRLRFPSRMPVWAVAMMVVPCLLGAAPVQEAAEVQLVRNGQALLPIILSDQASPRIHELARDLTNVLKRMSGATFTITNQQGGSGLVLGVASNFPALTAGQTFVANDQLRREEYILRSQADKLHLIGATDVAVQNAVWDLLYRFGYRQFFPGPTWEVIPAIKDLSISVNTFEKPDFYTRQIWYGHGMWGYNNKPYADWCVRNRAIRGFKLSTSHMYQSVIRRNREVFAEHPEYLALVDGERKGNKFCISNPDLRAFVVDYVRTQLEKNPDLDCVSMEPSDGGGWCECDACAEMGSISDHVVTLANQVARMLRDEFPGTHVGFLAYNQHGPPPSKRVEPNVIVKVQTHFIRGGYTHTEMVQGWQAQGATLGVGDYYSVFLWDYSRPASPKGSDLARIKESIPRFYDQGARFFMCESSDLWGALGLGHYVAARLLWDTEEAHRFEAITDDFFMRAFGPAREPMERFYRRIYRFEASDRRPLIRSDLVARLYRDLADARKLAAQSPEILARVDDLLLFTRYEDLFQQRSAAKGAAKTEAVTALLRHIWRMRETMMIHAKPAFSRLAPKDKDGKRVDLEPYRDSTPFTEQEKQTIIEEGIARYQPIEMGFEPISFSEDLVPATSLNLDEVADGIYTSPQAPMGTQTFYTWREEDDPQDFIKLRVSGGHIVHYRNIASPVQVSLYADANPMVGEPVAFDDSVPPNGTDHDLILSSEFPGLHRLKVVPPSNRAKADRLDPGPMTLPARLDEYNRLTGIWTLYFYVPRGTQVVGGFKSGGRGLLKDSAGEVHCDFSKLPATSYFHVAVPAGQDGRLWKFEACSGRRTLLTVPPYMARNAAALLLPKEVVEQDAVKDVE